MYVGIDCRELRGELTGIGRILIEFLNSISSKKTKHKFILFGNQNTYLEYEFLKKNMFQKIYEPERITLVWDQIKLKKLLYKYSIDIFFSPYYKIPLFTRTKKISSIFDVTYLLVKPDKNSFKNKYYVRNFIKLAFKKVETIITCSNYTKYDLLKILNLPKDKIKVVYLAISPKFKTIERAKVELVKKKYGIDKKYILYVGRFKSYKNVGRLVDAYNLLPKAIKKEYCLVLGGGETKSLITAYRRLAVRDLQPIICVGHISEEDLPAIYSGAELFVFLSLYEGFGLPPLEAMACGCPVVSSNTSSMPEVLGKAAFFFNPYDAKEICKVVIQMLEDENLRNSFRQKGLARAKLFSSEKMTDRMLDIFEASLS